MKKSKLLTVAILGLGLSASAAIAAGMSAKEFKDTHVGKCVTYKGPSNGTQCYNANGTSTYNDASYGKDTGSWEFRNGQFCVTWSKEGSMACTTYNSDGNGQYSGGGYTWTVN